MIFLAQLILAFFFGVKQRIGGYEREERREEKREERREKEGWITLRRAVTRCNVFLLHVAVSSTS